MDNINTKVSFIIPALNEEHRIASLIDDINLLGTDYNYEIIVADGNSTDKTVEIAEKMGAIVIKESKDAPKTIANGRNTGASIATGEIYIFCDADTVIRDPAAFLSEVFSVFTDEEIIGGAPKLSIFPEETILKDKIFHYLFNRIVRFSFSTKGPICGGQCQIVRERSFRIVNGYNINIVHGEDSDFFKRLRKIGKLHFFTNLVVYESPRRYRQFGYILLLMQGVYSLIYQQIFKKNVFKEWRRVDKVINNNRKSVFIY
jgi:glycosyltransferase involved in cell wall biosynthesis